MHSHKENLASSTKMLHPCHGEAWKQFDADFPNFAEDARNVRLGIATDGFTPYKLNAPLTLVGQYFGFPIIFHLVFV